MHIGLDARSEQLYVAYSNEVAELMAGLGPLWPGGASPVMK